MESLKYLTLSPETDGIIEESGDPWIQKWLLHEELYCRCR